MQRLYRHFRRAFVGMLAALAIAGCADRATGPEGPQGEFVFTASVLGTTISTMVVEVTAADISGPLAFNIVISNGTANGVIRLPPGDDRTITLRAFDNLGNETHEGSKTINVRPGQNPPVSIPVVSRSGQVTINAVMGPVGVTISPTSANIQVGGTTQLTVTITAPNGDVLSGPAAFATLNPTIATVGAAGLVTGVAEGTVQIVATFAGVGAGTTINVGQASPPVGGSRMAVVGVVSVSIYDLTSMSQVATYSLPEQGFSAAVEGGIIYAGSISKIYKVSPTTGITGNIGAGFLAGHVYGLSVRNGILYASGSAMPQVMALTVGGVPNGQILSPAAGSLTGNAFGPDGSFYLTAGLGAAVQRWNPGFVFAGPFAPSSLIQPYGVDVRPNGEVVVTAGNQPFYYVYSSNGTFLRSVPVACVPQLRDVVADASGNLYVACPDEDAIVKFNSQDQEVARINNVVAPSGLTIF